MVWQIFHIFVFPVTECACRRIVISYIMMARLTLLFPGLLFLLTPAFHLSARTVADTLIVTDSSRYVGQYPEGRGVLYSDSDGLFIGEFRNSVPDGKGVHYLLDGSIYTGEFSAGRHCGTGRFFSDSGKILSGEFRDDYANGQDTLWYPDGSVYVGECRYGRPVPVGSPGYGRLYRGAHVPRYLADAKPEYSGPDLTEEQRSFLEKAGRQYRKLVKNDHPPRFQGKDANAFAKWVTARLEYPASESRDGQSRVVRVKFRVAQDGSVSDVEVVESPGDAFSREVVRVVLSSPLWSPGIYEGRKVSTTYVFPVVFR